MSRKRWLWEGESVPAAVRLVVNVALDEEGDLLMAVPLQAEEGFASELRGWLAGLEFAEGEREAGLLELRFEKVGG